MRRFPASKRTTVTENYVIENYSYGEVQLRRPSRDTQSKTNYSIEQNKNMKSINSV